MVGVRKRIGGQVPRYLIERSFTVGQEQMNAVGRRSREIAEARFPSIAWEHSHVAVAEIVGDVTPADFPS
jgi:hypothetical protein